MTKQDITRLFKYTEWANHLILDVSAPLSEEQLHRDFQTGQHSVFETLAHMLGAEWVWLERWEGKTYQNLGELEAPYKTAGASLANIRAGWKEIESNRSKFIAGLTEETLHGSITYKNTRGEEFSQPLVDQMQHVVNHATHHRGQIVGFLRALGVKPPTTDMIHYFRVIE
jgi:uncharacterized damage-inducible protein DinB